MLSRRASGIQPSGIRRIFELVASMEDPINLSIGQAHFDVPEAVKEAAIAAIREGFNRYTVTQGLPELNARILDRLRDRYGLQGRHSLVTAGVSGGLMLGYLGLLDPGDHILLPDPYFTMYPVLADMVSATWSTYDLYPGTPLTEDALEAKLTERTKMILVNSPSNPSGRTLTGDELDAVGRVAERHDLIVLSDEIYEDFVYDGPHVSAIGHVPEERLLQLGGFSKTYGMPGWRMGWAVGPQPLVDAMRLMQQFSFVCAPSMAQKACLVAFDVDMSGHIAAYAGKRDRILAGIGGHYEVASPGGSFYIFPKLPPGCPDSAAFLERALERKLLVVPGKAFSARDTHFRLSFAAGDDVLERGVEALVELAESFARG
ncbi:MAG: aminotransferase class I/II-fold pyridoxal phosphate-dependent enzyme [Planctomycetes bacterium]|nr:aminotransferase class I/II-fold pyridoxal phosphate-dependent enzyme [Planctomycetota bacterium]